jgi:hypothetical protein
VAWLALPPAACLLPLHCLLAAAALLPLREGKTLVGIGYYSDVELVSVRRGGGEMKPAKGANAKMYIYDIHVTFDSQDVYIILMPRALRADRRPT